MVGSLVLCGYFCYGHCYIIHRLSERLLWMVAMFIIAFGFFSLIPMGNKYPSVIPQGVHFNPDT